MDGWNRRLRSRYCILSKLITERHEALYAASLCDSSATCSVVHNKFRQEKWRKNSNAQLSDYTKGSHAGNNSCNESVKRLIHLATNLNQSQNNFSNKHRLCYYYRHNSTSPRFPQKAQMRFKNKWLIQPWPGLDAHSWTIRLL